MATFENPANGYREEAGGLIWLWALLFGLFYFLVKGLWTHAAIQTVLIIGSAAALGPAGIPVMFLVWIGYTFAAPGIVRARYQRLGWREVHPDSPPFRASGTSQPRYPASQPAASDTRECPRCAETIKRAAKVCRFCGLELQGSEPSAETTSWAFKVGDSVHSQWHGVGIILEQTRPGFVLVQFADSDAEVAERYLRSHDHPANTAGDR